MKLISREKAIEDPHFASFLYGWQNSNKPYDDKPLFEDGNCFDEATNVTRFFSKEEFVTAHNKKLADVERLIDDKPILESRVVATIVIDTPDEVSSITYFTNVLIELLESQNATLIFVPLFKTNWFNDEEIKNHHPSTKIAYNQLKKYVGKCDHSGGVMISSKQDLEKFLPIYFDLIEGDYIPYGFFYSEQLKIVFSYHHHGQLWCYCPSKKSVYRLEDFIKNKDLIVNDRFTYITNE